jgi:hypothetical protein
MEDDAIASFAVEAGVGLPRAPALVVTPTRHVCSLRSQTCHPPRKGEGKETVAFLAAVALPNYTLIIRLPRFSPASNPISAAGVFSRPSMTSSCTLIWPEATQACRSFSAASRWSM